jgi:class 3 adenylate cyclase
VERKLAAILCADVYGYSRLMGEDEEATLQTLTSHRKLIDSQIERHRGRFVSSAGDSVLAEFASVVEAVNCAIDIQIALKAENANLPPERRMEFRIGVNLGDVMVEGEQIYGDGVNVAARLESLADPGGSVSRVPLTTRCVTSWRWPTKMRANRWSRISRAQYTFGGFRWMVRRLHGEQRGKFHQSIGAAAYCL